MTTIPEGAMDVLVWPLLCTIVGLGIWFLGMKVEFNTEKAVVKWLALVPLSIGIFIGANSVMHVMEYGYRELLDRKLTLYSHYLALLLPLGAILLILGLNWNQKRQKAHDIF